MRYLCYVFSMSDVNQQFAESLLISPYLSRISATCRLPETVNVNTLEAIIATVVDYSALGFN